MLPLDQRVIVDKQALEAEAPLLAVRETAKPQSDSLETSLKLTETAELDDSNKVKPEVTVLAVAEAALELVGALHKNLFYMGPLLGLCGA